MKFEQLKKLKEQRQKYIDRIAEIDAKIEKLETDSEGDKLDIALQMEARAVMLFRKGYKKKAIAETIGRSYNIVLHYIDSYERQKRLVTSNPGQYERTEAKIKIIDDYISEFENE